MVWNYIKILSIFIHYNFHSINSLKERLRLDYELDSRWQNQFVFAIADFSQFWTRLYHMNYIYDCCAFSIQRQKEAQKLQKQLL